MSEDWFCVRTPRGKLLPHTSARRKIETVRLCLSYTSAHRYMTQRELVRHWEIRFPGHEIVTITVRQVAEKQLAAERTRRRKS